MPRASGTCRPAAPWSAWQDDSAAAATTCATSCANLKKLGCKEGIDTTCVATCQKMVAKKIVKVPLACFSKAKTKAVARACGGIDCQ